MADQVGMQDVRGENISRAVKGFALKKFKLRQVLTINSSNKWTETYYRETAAELSPAGETWNIKGVARGAAFPHVDPSWTKVQGVQLKFAAETTVHIEDKLLDAIDVQRRSILRVARAVANSTDAYIYSTLSGATGIGTAAAADNWDSATIANRDPIGDILAGIQNLDESNYDALENGFLLVSPKDYKNLIRNQQVVKNPSFKTADVVSNGRVGQIVGLTIIKTTSVTADEAMIIVGQQAATWKGAVQMRSKVTEQFGVKDVLQTYEIGHLQVTDPAAIYVITNTQV
jgi:hypothetical protein|tara:strand:+ start:2887 stop:3747 length:861 start_codon:yes stop_codon:yes gene_type:complete